MCQPANVLQDKAPEGGFVDTAAPHHFVRQAEVDGKRFLIVSGGNHHQGCGPACGMASLCAESD